MKNLSLPAFFALLLLPACGQIESAKMRPAGGGALAVQSSNDPQFQQACQARSGIISSDGTICFTRVGKALTAGSTDLVVDASVTNGNFLVSSGSSNVILTLNGRFVATANARIPLNAGAGQLSFNVADSASTATAYVYHCFDHGMAAVACRDAQIPR